MSVFMDIATANPSFVTVNAEGIVTLTYDAYIKSNVSKVTGKWYAEVKVATAGFNVGVAKESYFTATKRTGAYSNFNYSMPTLLACSNGNLYDGRGTVGGSFTYVGSAIKADSVIGILVDMDNKRIRFSVNGTSYSYVDLLHDEPVCIIVSGNNPTGVSSQTLTVNLGSKDFSSVPKDLPYDARAFDDSRYAREDLSLPFLEKGDKKYVVKKGIVELKPPIRSVHSLDSMVEVTASSQMGIGDPSWGNVFTPYNLLNQHSDHRNDVWATENGTNAGEIIIDYGRVNPMSGIRMTPRFYTSNTVGHGAMAVDFDIYGSVDGKAWTNLHEVRNSTGWSYTTVREFMFSETFFYRFLKFDFQRTQATNAQYLAVGSITVLVEEMSLVAFDKEYMEPLTELNLEELEGIADQVTENKVIVASREFNSSSEKALTGFKGARTIKLTGGEKVWEM